MCTCEYDYFIIIRIKYNIHISDVPFVWSELSIWSMKPLTKKQSYETTVEEYIKG